MEESSVDVKGFISVKEKKGEPDPNKLIGFIKIKISQKELTSDGKKSRKLESLFGAPKVDMSGYDNFVQQAVAHKKSAKERHFGEVQSLKNPVG